jgi:hypothetical protein
MLQATLHKKIGVLLSQHSEDAPAAWRAIIDRTEDTLTSTVFERLVYLPDNLATTILLRAARPMGMETKPEPGPILESLPWPNLADEGVLEPDWVLHTPSYTLVVEAKWGGGVVPGAAQLRAQWEAAQKRYPDRDVVQLIVVQSGRVRLPDGQRGLALRWGQLRAELLRELRADPPAHIARVLQDIRIALDRRGLDASYMRSLPAVTIRGSIEPWADARAPLLALPSVPAETIDPEASLTPWTSTKS